MAVDVDHDPYFIRVQQSDGLRFVKFVHAILDHIALPL